MPQTVSMLTQRRFCCRQIVYFEQRIYFNGYIDKIFVHCYNIFDTNQKGTTMKDIRFLQLITGIFKFKLIKDERGNEYILNSDNPLDSVGLIEDKTAFEASENHTHIIEKVRTADFEAACSVEQTLGELLFHSLKREYRDKEFVVFVSVTERIT